MKKLILIIVPALVFSIASLAQSAEQKDVQDVVTSAYIEGIHNRGSVDEIRKGFHPSFEMLRLMENEIRPLPIEDWIANIEKSSKDSKPAAVRTEGKFVNVDVTGNNAVVKLELYRGDKKTFTDYLVLYKFNEGWRIVSKTFYRHP